jgi:hypothetical protein
MMFFSLAIQAELSRSRRASEREEKAATPISAR